MYKNLTTTQVQIVLRYQVRTIALFNDAVHFQILLLSGVYIERPDGSLRFRWVSTPTSTELAWLTQTLARRIGRSLERQGLLECDAENSQLADDELESGPIEQLRGSSITYRIAIGP
jgi:hypothetical protein